MIQIKAPLKGINYQSKNLFQGYSFLKKLSIYFYPYLSGELYVEKSHHQLIDTSL